MELKENHKEDVKLLKVFPNEKVVKSILEQQTNIRISKQTPC